jgi:hypothetical protein
LALHLVRTIGPGKQPFKPGHWFRDPVEFLKGALARAVILKEGTLRRFFARLSGNNWACATRGRGAGFDAQCQPSRDQ